MMHYVNYTVMGKDYQAGPYRAFEEDPSCR